MFIFLYKLDLTANQTRPTGHYICVIPVGRGIGSSTTTQGFFSRPVDPNRRPPVPVYRTSWTGNRFIPAKLKFEFKWRSSTGSYWYTGRLDRYTGRFDRFTGRFDRFTGRFDW